MKRTAVYIIFAWLLLAVIILLYLPFIADKVEKNTRKANTESYSGEIYVDEELFTAVWSPHAVTEEPEEEETADFIVGESSHPFKLIDAPLLCQNPKYPSGCEAFATVMALQFYGFDITPKEFIAKYLPMGTRPYEKKGVWYGADPNEAFLGRPDSDKGMGIWARGIEKALSKVPGIRKFSYFCIYDETLDSLCEKYVSDGVPVIVWVTQNMEKPYVSLIATVENSEKTYQWISPNHCMLLVGFDEKYYYFNDPIAGKLVRYDKEISETAFTGNGSQAVVIRRK